MLRNQFRSLLCLLVAFVLVMMVQFTTGLVTVNAQEAGEEYIVRAGDTLFEIAAEFYGIGSLWPRIMEATNAKAQEDNSFRTIEDADVIRVGQRLWIPPLEGAEDEAAIQAEETTENVSVQIVAPADGATVPRQFEVTTEAIGLTVEEAGEVREGAGHMHILVDTDFVEAGEVIPRDEQYIHFFRGELTGTLELEPGEHVLRLQFSDGAHLALEGDQYRDQITVTVSDEGPAEEATGDVGVEFVTPADGATVPRQFEVTMAARGLTVEPAGEIREGAGHFHILVDTDYVAPGEVIPRDAQHIHFGQGELTATLELEPGEHVLRLQFSNGAHLVLEGNQYRDQITVTVRE